MESKGYGDGMNHVRTTGDKVFDYGNMLLLTVFSLLAVYPFWYTIVLSFSSAAEAMAPGFKVWPGEFNLTSYQMVFSNPDILIGYRNTVMRTVIGTSGVLLISSMMAYALARPGLVHKKGWMLFILLTMVFHGGLVPSYLLMRNLGLMDNFLVYILPGLVTGFNVIILKNFFQSIPSSVGESARIDGAGEWRILFQIYLPLSKPVLATVALWTAVAQWNAWFDALLYIHSDSKQVLQMFLQRVVIGNNTELIERNLVNPEMAQFTSETVKAATVIVTVLPILLVYPFLQRFFMKGIMLGSVKE